VLEFEQFAWPASPTPDQLAVRMSGGSAVRDPPHARGLVPSGLLRVLVTKNGPGQRRSAPFPPTRMEQLEGSSSAADFARTKFSQGLHDRFEARAARKFSNVELAVILAGAICAAIDFGALTEVIRRMVPRGRRLKACHNPT
jgi:hypothetical protein